ncbi:MAG: hypothetical protein AAF236_16135 [Verrucomicrobiota bacterium]
MIQPCYLRHLTLLSLLFATALDAEEPEQSDYYTITSIPAPEGEVIEGGAIELLPDGKVAVCTRRGRVWTVSNAITHPEKEAEWQVFAEYLHEPLGLAWKDGSLYAVQRPEVTRLTDEDGDGRADLFETVSDDWGISRDYHEYTFGTRFDDEGNLWCTLCLTGSSKANALYRGWVLRVNEDGTMLPTASGVRSPGGIGFNADGDVFYTDNQGLWNGSSSLKWVKPGSFQGNPNGNIYYAFAGDEMGPVPNDPPFDSEGSLTVVERDNIAEYVPPAVVFPHGRIGQSPTVVETDHSGGKFGPFAGQVFVGEQCHSEIQRVFLEKVNEVYQGAVFPFLEGFASGNIGVRMTPDGQLFTSGSNRGWGARGGKEFAFERVDWTGTIPFEIHEMRARADGFELTFTKPIDPQTLSEKTFRMEAFTYQYRAGYGSPEIEKVEPSVQVTKVEADNLSLRIEVDPMIRGHVHGLFVEGLEDADGIRLLNPEAYYTLNEIPGG